MAEEDFNNEIEELIDGIMEISTDDIQAVIGIVEDAVPSDIPTTPAIYKSVILDFISRMIEIQEEEEEEE